MKTLNTLIKFHQQQLDQLRRQMGALESQKVQLLALIERIRDELAKEIELSQKSNEMGMFFGDFAKRIREREESVRKEIFEIDTKMNILRELIRDAFIELKKFETARDNRKTEQQREHDRQETDQLDEAAAQQHERKGESSI